jgi:hypothetical protein
MRGQSIRKCHRELLQSVKLHFFLSLAMEYADDQWKSWTYADGVFDLTRSNLMNVTEPITITDMLGSRKTAVIEPSRSALVIIDMQSNIFSTPQRLQLSTILVTD